jgi:hypothetical protein
MAPNGEQLFRDMWKRRSQLRELTDDHVLVDIASDWPAKAPAVWCAAICGQVTMDGETARLPTPFGVLRNDVTLDVLREDGWRSPGTPLVLELQVPPHDPDEPASVLDAVRILTRNVSLFCSIVSMASESEVRWSPTRKARFQVPGGGIGETVEGLVSVSDPTKCSYVVINEDFENREIRQICNALSRLTNCELRTALETGLNLVWEGNSASGTARFVCYWNAIEYLSIYLYDALPDAAVSRPSRAEAEVELLRLFLDVKTKNIHSTADAIAALKRPSPRKKINAVAKVLETEHSTVINDGADFTSRLFRNGSDGEPSLYDIRNAIAHGRAYEDVQKYTAQHQSRVHEMRLVSRVFVLWAIRQSAHLERLIVAKASQ